MRNRQWSTAAVILALAAVFVYGPAAADYANATFLSWIEVSIPAEDKVDGRVLTYDTSTSPPKFKLEASSAAAGVNSITAGTNVTLGGTAADPIINASGATANTIQQGGAGFATGIDTWNLNGLTLSRSGSTLTVTNAVSTTAFLSGDGSATTPVSPTYESLYFDLDGSNQLTLRDAGQGNGIPLGKMKALSSASLLIGAGASSSAVRELGTVGALDVSGNNLILSTGENGATGPIVDSNGVSMSYNGILFDSNVAIGPGSGYGALDMRLGVGLKAAHGLELNMPIQVGGSLFAHAEEVNLVGFTVSRSGDVATVTNGVSTSGDLSGDGSSGSPVTYTNPGLAVQAGGSAFASGIKTLNQVGSEMSRSGDVLTVTTRVSVTGGGISGDGSEASPLSVAAAGTSNTIQQGGSGFATGIDTWNINGLTLSRSANTLTVTNSVSTTAPVGGDGSAASPVSLAFDTSLENEGGSLSLNGPVQVGGSAFANFKTLNLVGFTVSRAADVLTVTNSVSVSSPLSGDGSSGSPIDLTISTGLEDSSGIRLAMVWQDEDAGSTAAQSGNVSGSQVSASHSGGEVTINHTPTTFQNAGGSDIGSFPYVRIGANITPTIAQPDVLLLTGNAGGSLTGKISGAGATAIDTIDVIPGDGIDAAIASTTLSVTGSWSPWSSLGAGTEFATTAPSTSTLTMIVDNTGKLKVGQALRYKVSGTYYYGICTAVTASLLTIGGAPLTTGAGDVTELAYAKNPGQTEMLVYTINGNFADAADTALLANDLLLKQVWLKPAAKCVYFRVVCGTADTGANDPRVNVRLGSTATDYVSTSNTNAGLAVNDTAAATVVDIETSKYSVTFGDTVEIKADANGTNDDARDLTIIAVFVYTGA